MRGSLQEQLLKSGIATEEQLKKNQPKKTSNSGKGNNSNRNKSAGKVNKPNTNSNAYKKTPAHNKPASSAQTKAPEEPKSLGKALRTEIKQLLKTNKLNDKAGEIPYNYVIAGQVKRFYINNAQQTELKAGNLVIVNWNTISYLISKEAEQELRKLHPTIEVASVQKTEETTGTNSSSVTSGADAADDPYAGYEIPDDLSW